MSKRVKVDDNWEMTRSSDGGEDKTGFARILLIYSFMTFYSELIFVTSRAEVCKHISRIKHLPEDNIC